MGHLRFAIGSLFVAGLVVAGCCGGCLSLNNWLDGYGKVATIKCGPGRTVVVYGPNGGWESARYLYYDVRVDGEIVKPRTVMTLTHVSPLRFDVSLADNGDLAGIRFARETGEDYGFIVTHDFTTNDVPTSERLKLLEQVIARKPPSFRESP